MDAIFTAMDVADLSTNATTALVAFVGLALCFVGYKIVKRILAKA